MRAQAGRVQVVVANVVWGASGHDEAAGASGWAVQIVLVVEARRREVGSWCAGSRASHFWEGTGLRVRGVRRSRIAAERRVGATRFLLPALGTGRLLGFGVDGLDVTFVLELGDELLDNLHLEVVEDISDGLVRDEEAAQLVGQAAAVLFLLAVVTTGDELDAHGEVRCLNDVADGAVEAVNVVGADGEAADLDLGAHAVDAEDKVHGRLLVLVDEAEGAEAGVPRGGEPRRERFAFF